MSLLHREAGRPFEDDPPSADLVAELRTQIAGLVTSHRRLEAKVAEQRAEIHDLKCDLDRAHRELAHAHRDLARRWWQR